MIRWRTGWGVVAIGLLLTVLIVVSGCNTTASETSVPEPIAATSMTATTTVPPITSSSTTATTSTTVADSGASTVLIDFYAIDTEGITVGPYGWGFLAVAGFDDPPRLRTFDEVDAEGISVVRYRGERHPGEAFPREVLVAEGFDEPPHLRIFHEGGAEGISVVSYDAEILVAEGFDEPPTHRTFHAVDTEGISVARYREETYPREILIAEGFDEPPLLRIFYEEGPEALRASRFGGEILVVEGFDEPPLYTMTADDIEAITDSTTELDAHAVNLTASEKAVRELGDVEWEAVLLVFRVTIGEETTWGWLWDRGSPSLPMTALIFSPTSLSVYDDPNVLPVWSRSTAIGGVPLSDAIKEAWLRSQG